ncbi:MAG TPA: VWA domain-containing protein [Thermoanaerobaculia bacterium]|nr:VWA domain-containing protein [Thermoanaerobaculia bacterium]
MKRPSSSSLLLLPLLLLPLLLRQDAGAQAPAAPAVGGLRVSIVTPRPGEPAFGDVEVKAAVQGNVTKVEFYLDGLRVGLAEAPPWEVVIDVGQQNIEHRIEVVAYDRSGRTATTSLKTGVITSDEEINVALRPLFVNVARGDQPVLDLGRGDFEVFDNGARQQLVTFERGDIPFTAALLLDSSSSMEGGLLETALDGAKSFARAMKSLDEAKLLLFSDRILLETPFTSAPSILTLGLGSVEAGGGTALNDSMYLALKKLEPRTGRRVLIMLSDGVDVESVIPMKRVRTLAQGNQVVIYWLRLRSEEEQAEGPVPSFTAWRDVESNMREKALLRETVLESGGRILNVDSVDQVGGALARVLKELREQYVLGYYPSSSKGSGSWHDVKVQVRRGGLSVRTHRGYIEP